MPHRETWRLLKKNFRAGVSSLGNYLSNRAKIHLFHDFTLKPLIATYYVTHRCNLKCLYCTEKYSDRDTVDVDTRGACEILRKIRKEMSIIYFTGGEPLVRPDIVEIVAEARRLKFYPIYLGTNGLLLPLRDKVVDLVDRLVISLDSMDAENWDIILNAGRGQAHRIYEIIRHYAARQEERDFTIMINCVITKTSIEQVHKVMEFCFDHNLLFSPVSATVDSLPDPSLMRMPEYQRLVRHILDLKEQGYHILGTVESIETLLLGKKFPCFATLSPHIYPNGDVFYPCQPLERIGGNLMQLESVTATYKEGEKKFGKWHECWRGCTLNCYVLNSYYMNHFWDQIVKESLMQFAMGPAHPTRVGRPRRGGVLPLPEPSGSD